MFPELAELMPTFLTDEKIIAEQDRRLAEYLKSLDPKSEEE